MILQISDDFSLDKIISCGQCFRAKKCYDGSYLFPYQNRVLTIRPLSPEMYEVDADSAAWTEIWSKYFDLSRNYRDARQIIPDSDNFMKKAAAEGEGIRILRQDPWETLISFIISQRKSIPAIKQSIQLLSERFGSLTETGFGAVYSFPSPLQLSSATENDLRECKVGYRAPFIRDAIDQVLSGKINLQTLSDCSYDEIITALLRIKGVGIKIANCTALFSFGQTSAAPVDTWILKIIEKEYDGINPFSLYGNNAGIMQQYAFFYAQNHKEEFSGR